MGSMGEDETAFMVWNTLLPLSACILRCRECQFHEVVFCISTRNKNLLVMTPEWAILESCFVAIPALARVALHVERPSTMFGVTRYAIVLVLGARL